MTAPLKPGDRFALTPTGRNAARPKGSQAGVIVSDRGDCWEVRYDGTTSTRWLFKSYARPEWQAAVDAA